MTNTIQLQGIGTVSAKPAAELQIGDITIWNFGHKAVVLGKVKETAAFVTLLIEEKEGTFTRRLKKTRLVGCKA